VKVIRLTCELLGDGVDISHDAEANNRKERIGKEAAGITLQHVTSVCLFANWGKTPGVSLQARYNWGPHVWVGGTHAPSLFGPSCETTYFWSVVLPFIIIIISLDTLVSKLSVHLYHRK